MFVESTGLGCALSIAPAACGCHWRFSLLTNDGFVLYESSLLADFSACAGAAHECYPDAVFLDEVA